MKAYFLLLVFSLQVVDIRASKLGESYKDILEELDDVEDQFGKLYKVEEELLRQPNDQEPLEEPISYPNPEEMEWSSTFPEPIEYPGKEEFDAYEDESEINGDAKQPPYPDTVYPLSYLIDNDDESLFPDGGIKYRGRQYRKFWRNKKWNCDSRAHIFLFHFLDGIKTEFWVHSTFDLIEAKELITKISIYLGRIPQFLRLNLKVVQIMDGNDRYSGSRSGIVHVPKKQLDKSINEHWIEEVLVHEMGHTTLDSKIYGNKDWKNAVSRDPGYISRYARKNPDTEDVAESILNWLGIVLKTIKRNDEKKTKDQIPNRLNFFDKMNFDLFPFDNKKNPSNNKVTGPSTNWKRIDNSHWYCDRQKDEESLLTSIKTADKQTCRSSKNGNRIFLARGKTKKQCAKLAFEDERCGDGFELDTGNNGWCGCGRAGTSNHHCHEDNDFHSTSSVYMVMVNNKHELASPIIKARNQGCRSRNNNNNFFLASGVTVKNCALLAYNSVKCGKAFDYNRRTKSCSCGVVGTSNELCEDDRKRDSFSDVYWIKLKNN